MAKKTKKETKSPKKEPKVEKAPELDITEEEIKEEQKEIELLEDAIALEPEDLNDDQKEIIRKNKDKLPDEQQEYYKDILKESKEPEAPEPDYKKKFSESSREAQKKTAANRVMNKALADAESIPEPTEEELMAEFTDWDVMGDTEKALAKETLISRKWRETIAAAKEQATKIERWNDSVDEFVNDPKTLIDNPSLEGKQETFSEFAKLEENNSVPLKTLTAAFLYENSKGTSKKGKMFETGSGGPNDKPQPKSDQITLEEARQLKESNYDKWKEYLMAGKIKMDI